MPAVTVADPPENPRSASLRGVEVRAWWDEDAEFGYEVASEIPGINDAELLQPRRLYERQGRMDEYHAFVERLKRERAETLSKYPDLTEDIIRAVS